MNFSVYISSTHASEGVHTWLLTVDCLSSAPQKIPEHTCRYSWCVHRSVTEFYHSTANYISEIEESVFGQFLSVLVPLLRALLLPLAHTHTLSINTRTLSRSTAAWICRFAINYRNRLHDMVSSWPQQLFIDVPLKNKSRPTKAALYFHFSLFPARASALLKQVPENAPPPLPFTRRDINPP